MVIMRGCQEDTTTGCWVWVRQRNKHGYGHVCVGTRRSNTGKTCGIGAGAHRVSYELHIGKIPAGLQIDHLCRNRACVNPQHLEPVSAKENVNRGETIAKAAKAATSCKRGHVFTDSSTRRWPDGRRACKICERSLRKARKQKKAGAA